MTGDQEVKALREQFERLTRRVRVLNVVAVGSLLLALAGGTAWATSRYLITSTKQIKPSVLREIQSQAAEGPQGARGPQGPQGFQGPEGPQGPQGLSGQDARDSAVAGYSAASCMSGGGGFGYCVNIPYETDGPPPVAPPPTVLVSKQLPPGYFIANGQAVIGVLDTPEYWDVVCNLTDTPGAGTPASDAAEWLGVPEAGHVQLPNDLATNTLGFTLAIDSPDSASTLTISCLGIAPNANPTTPSVGLTGQATVTAIQTAGND